MPLLWVFGSRNDIFLWLTGWNFGTFNVFHRWVARVATVQVIIHSVAYTVSALKSMCGVSGIFKAQLLIGFVDGGAAQLASSFKEEYWYTGVMVSKDDILFPVASFVGYWSEKG